MLVTVATVLVEGMRTVFVNVPRSSAVDAYMVLIGVVVYVTVVVGIITSTVVVEQEAEAAWGSGLLTPSCTKMGSTARDNCMIVSGLSKRVYGLSAGSIDVTADNGQSPC